MWCAVMASVTRCVIITSMLSMALQALTTDYAIGTILPGVPHRALSITTRGRAS